jgi:transposase
MMREKIIRVYENGKSPVGIAAMFRCHQTTVDRIILIYTRESRIEPKRRGSLRPQLLIDKHKVAIRGYIAENCSITLDS